MKRPEIKVQDQYSQQAMQYEINFYKMPLGQLSRSEATNNSPQVGPLIDDPSNASLQTPKNQQPKQAMHLLPWGEEALGL